MCYLQRGLKINTSRSEEGLWCLTPLWTIFQLYGGRSEERDTKYNFVYVLFMFSTNLTNGRNIFWFGHESVDSIF